MTKSQPVKSIDEQIAEVGREIGLRKNVYPMFIARGKLTEAEAAEHTARMEAVYRTLKWVKANREALLSVALEVPS